MFETLIWNKPVLGSDVQDPLGLELRMSTRMAGQLLHCVTTVTPRARYYSFLPWCVKDYRDHLKGQPADRGLVDAIRHREKAMALGCVTHHEGSTCDFGGVVGSKEAQRKWSSTDLDESFDLRRYRKQGSMAWYQYFNSLMNLGCFEEMEPTEDDDAVAAEETTKGLSPDEIRLTPLGHQLAEAFAVALGLPRVLAELRSDRIHVNLRALGRFGKRGGICEIHGGDAQDRNLLRSLFFNRVSCPGRSHALRRLSLLLILDLVRQCAEVGIKLDWLIFGDMVIYGATMADDTIVKFSCPSALQGVAAYWRMFYLHNHMSVALEGAFLALIRAVEESERGNVRFEAILASLGDKSISSTFAKAFGVGVDSFGDMTPAQLFGSAGVPQRDGRPIVGEEVSLNCPLAEWRLASALRRPELVPMTAPAGLATCLTLLCTALLRFDEFREHESGIWCARNVRDSYLDLAPPLVATWLEQWDRAWWHRRWTELARVILDRFVIRQHEVLGYDKGAGSDRMILHSNDGVLTATGEYGRITIGNPRFRNALQILSDLGLVDLPEVKLTANGEAWLAEELLRS